MKNDKISTRRMTKQKAAILKYLKETTSHPNAEKIYQALHMEIPNLSRSTVYRNLAQLSEDNIIDKMVIKSDFDHFDGNTNPHNHFICENCGKIYDCENGMISNCDLSHIGKINNYVIYFYGTCNQCKAK